MTLTKGMTLFFASVAFFIILMVLNFDLINKGISDPIYVLKIASFAAVVFGIIGNKLGKIFEQGWIVAENNPKDIQEKIKDKELIIDDILVYDIGVKKKKQGQDDNKEEEAPSPQQ
jgi:hypothetical protein